MNKNISQDFNISKFLTYISVKKQYLKQLNEQIFLIENIRKKNYKILYLDIFFKKPNCEKKLLVEYILDISFSKTNTLFHITDCSGNMKFFYSAGSFNYKGKQKLARVVILRKFYKTLVSQLTFLKNKPIAIHFRNASFRIFWLLKKLGGKISIVVVKNFNLHSYNGCRRRKVKRKKNIRNG